MCIAHPQVKMWPLTMQLPITYELKASLCSAAFLTGNSCLGLQQEEHHYCRYMGDIFLMSLNCFLSDTLSGLPSGFGESQAFIILEAF